LILVTVGGYGDASSFLLVRCFTGHTTGNSVLAAIAITTGGRVLEPLLAVGCFLCATALSLRVHSSSAQPLDSNAFRCVLLAEIVLLFLSPYALMAQHRLLFIACMCATFGLQNGAFSKAAGVALHTTYLTGTLTRMLSRLVGGDSASIPSIATKFIPFMWCAFVTGALLAGAAIFRAGPRGIWGMPLLLAVVLAMSSLSRSA
jgi:uncharacterized membrane protein YoaK (UPF0700 family)